MRNSGTHSSIPVTDTPCSVSGMPTRGEFQRLVIDREVDEELLQYPRLEHAGA